MCLLSKFSKVEKNFPGQCDCLTWNKFLSLQNIALFRILAFSRIYEVPTIVIGNTTDHYDLLKTLKENGGLCETKTKRWLEGAFLRWYFARIPGKYLFPHWKGTAENNCIVKFIVLSFGYADGEANRCNRFLVAEVRNHEGKPYFRDIEKKVWLFYEVNCHRKAPSKTGFSPHCFRLKYGSNLTWTLFLMIVSRVNATKCEM